MQTKAAIKVGETRLTGLLCGIHEQSGAGTAKICIGKRTHSHQSVHGAPLKNKYEYFLLRIQLTTALECRRPGKESRNTANSDAEKREAGLLQK